MNLLNFNKKEDFNKLMEHIRPIILLCEQFGYKNPDKLYTWSKMTLKQIVL